MPVTKEIVDGNGVFIIEDQCVSTDDGQALLVVMGMLEPDPNIAHHHLQSLKSKHAAVGYAATKGISSPVLSDSMRIVAMNAAMEPLSPTQPGQKKPDDMVRVGFRAELPIKRRPI